MCRERTWSRRPRSEQEVKSLLFTADSLEKSASEAGRLRIVRLSTRYALENTLGPVLKRVLHLAHELVGYGAVDGTVVVGKREIDHRADGDRVVYDHRPLFDCA